MTTPEQKARDLLERLSVELADLIAEHEKQRVEIGELRSLLRETLVFQEEGEALRQRIEAALQTKGTSKNEEAYRYGGDPIYTSCPSCGEPEPRDGHVCRKWHGTEKESSND